MKKLIVGLLLVSAGVLLLVSIVIAGTVDLEWDPIADATSYQIEQSINNGAAWTVVNASISPAVCTGTPVVCRFTHTAPAAGLVLFRFSARNAVGITTRYDGGVWHCQSCAPPAQPTALGLK